MQYQTIHCPYMFVVLIYTNVHYIYMYLYICISVCQKMTLLLLPLYVLLGHGLIWLTEVFISILQYLTCKSQFLKRILWTNVIVKPPNRHATFFSTLRNGWIEIATLISYYSTLNQALGFNVKTQTK